MFKLSLPLVLAIALTVAATPMGTAAAQVNLGALEAELATSEYFNPESYKVHKQYLLETQRVELVTHTVKRGETLLSIAAAYNVSVATIGESNGISNVHLIHPGQKLVFPAVSGLLYTVAQGDNIFEIAEKFEVDIGSIWFANGLETIQLEPDSKIIVPGAKLPDPPPMRVVASRSVSTASISPNISIPGFIWPVQGRITSPFGMRGRYFHGGLDISGRTGTPIKAAAAGVVIFSGYRGSYGYLVEIEHNQDVVTLYSHASRLLVKVGETVQQGQVIARVGTSGFVTGPHLHFEVRIRGKQYNPRQFLP